jgi:hypothetical protein
VGFKKLKYFDFLPVTPITVEGVGGTATGARTTVKPLKSVPGYNQYFASADLTG